MKTPKRYPASMSVYISSKACFDDRARWKRKNRIKQLKATIARLRAENTHLRIELAEALTECYSGYHKGVDVGFSQGFKHGSRELIKLEMLNAEHRKENQQ
jgi:hypothetical protein